MSKTWKVANHVSFNRVDGDIVLMDTRQSKYFGLDETASLIWEVVAETGCRDQAVEAILERYDIDEESVARDVDGAILLWLEKGWLEESSC